MTICNIHLSARGLFALLVLAFLTGCSSGGGSFPQIASPPPFDYADGAALRSQMHRLAFALQQLDMALASDMEHDPASPSWFHASYETRWDSLLRGFRVAGT